MITKIKTRVSLFNFSPDERRGLVHLVGVGRDLIQC
jgi:hypothetical protein